MKTKISLLALTLLTAITFSNTAKAQSEGETLFNTVCIACHTIGGGLLVGPDLKDVHKTRKQDWLIGFIRSSQTMIDNDDADAVALFEKYNMIPMPDNDFTDEQIKSVISYIKSQSGGETVAETETESAEEKEETPATDEEPEVAGQDESAATVASTSTVVKPEKEEVMPPPIQTAEMSQSSFFSKPLNVIILSVIVILLIIILVLSRTIHALSSELKR